MYDLAIIGAGAVGSSIARELSKYQLKVCVIEKECDVSNGTSKANSGILHGGYDAKPGTLKAKLNVEGTALFQQLNNALHFGFNPCGSFVLGFDDEDLHEIQRLFQNGKKNGVHVEIVDRDFILRKEPHINPQVKFALYCPNAGIISPWEYTIAMAENAADNGVDFILNHLVMDIKRKASYFNICTDKRVISARFIVNASGLYSDTIAKMLGMDAFTVTPRKGEYLLFDKEIGNLTGSVLFQTPKNGSKGVLVTPTYHGNIMIGPNAEVIDDKTDVSTTQRGLSKVFNIAKRTLPSLDYSKIITQFSGLRASTIGYDFIIEESKIPHFINVAGIDSPGLSSAPAIAIYVRKILEDAGLELKAKATFCPNVSPITRMDQLTIDEKNEMINKNPRYGRIICRCESITQGEIVEALHRPIPATTLDSIKRRVRAGAGRCQGGFCSPKVMEIITDELNTSPLEIKKSESRSYILMDRTKNSLEDR
ncbi:MAG: NAD(P)/FAD-dependent oxidoreductase [Eubacteriales bacterium]